MRHENSCEPNTQKMEHMTKTWHVDRKTLGCHQCRLVYICTHTFNIYIFISFFRNATLQLIFFKKLIEK